MANKHIIPKYQILLRQIENQENVKVLYLANIFFNYYAEKDGDQTNLFMKVPFNEEFAKSLHSCLLNSSLKVLVLWGFSFDEQSEKLISEGIEKSKTLRFVSLRDCDNINSIYDAIGNNQNISYFGVSCGKLNKNEVIMSILQLRQKNKNVIINIVKEANSEDSRENSFENDID